MNTNETQIPPAPAAGSEPSPSAVQLVRDWLWLSPARETAGSPWTDQYVRDAARMVEVALAKHPHPNQSGVGQ